MQHGNDVTHSARTVGDSFSFLDDLQSALLALRRLLLSLSLAQLVLSLPLFIISCIDGIILTAVYVQLERHVKAGEKKKKPAKKAIA